MYELYAILIHSGGAYGGHYYAYIKDTEDTGKWHSFNDTAIMEIDVNEINDRVFGGNNTNAYLLFYRFFSIQINLLSDRDRISF